MATIETTAGVIRIELFENHAPKTVANFTGLATGEKEWRDTVTRENKHEPFYDNLVFHRIIPGFMIQGGCPQGIGTGGPGYAFDDEIHSELRFSEPYLLAMANSGKRPHPVTGQPSGTNGSQFFITVAPTPHLTGAHTIFGRVADDESKRVVDTIAKVPTDRQDRPVEDVVITSVTIS